jgi:uncharacterized membrane protein
MLKNYILFSLIFLATDYIYLNSVSKYFNMQIKAIQGEKINLNLFATFLCYLFLTTGIFYFAIQKNMSIMECALLGLFVYGVYETTNKAILKNWFYKTVVIDTLWGAVLFALSVFIYRKIVPYI